MIKTYEVEIASTTYRTFSVEAESEDDAVDMAFKEVDSDFEITKAWRQNAEVTFVQEEDSELDKLNQDL